MTNLSPGPLHQGWCPQGWLRSHRRCLPVQEAGRPRRRGHRLHFREVHCRGGSQYVAHHHHHHHHPTNHPLTHSPNRVLHRLRQHLPGPQQRQVDHLGQLLLQLEHQRRQHARLDARLLVAHPVLDQRRRRPPGRRLCGRSVRHDGRHHARPLNVAHATHAWTSFRKPNDSYNNNKH